MVGRSIADIYDQRLYIEAIGCRSISQCLSSYGCAIAMGMALLQLPNFLSSTYVTLEVLSLKHWYQSAFAETPSMAHHNREASNI